MKLNIKALALTGGIFWALTMCLSTAWVLTLGDGYNSMLDAMSSFYFGYEISWKGALISLPYGFVDGAVCGAVLAWVYNWLAAKLK